MPCHKDPPHSTVAHPVVIFKWIDLKQVCLKHHISLGASFVERNTNVVLDAVLYNQ